MGRNSLVLTSEKIVQSIGENFYLQVGAEDVQIHGLVKNVHGQYNSIKLGLFCRYIKKRFLKGG
jgi:hypothetical protein